MNVLVLAGISDFVRSNALKSNRSSWRKKVTMLTLNTDYKCSAKIWSLHRTRILTQEMISIIYVKLRSIKTRQSLM
jgi:hypothetical protein